MDQKVKVCLGLDKKIKNMERVEIIIHQVL